MIHSICISLQVLCMDGIHITTQEYRLSSPEMDPHAMMTHHSRSFFSRHTVLAIHKIAHQGRYGSLL